MVNNKLQKKYDVHFKRNVILLAERRGNAIAKRVYQVHESNIRRWRKYKSSIMRDWRRDLKSLGNHFFLLLFVVNT